MPGNVQATPARYRPLACILLGSVQCLWGHFVHPHILGYRSRYDLDGSLVRACVTGVRGFRKGLFARSINYAGLDKDRQSPAQPLATMPSEELGRLSGSSMCV